MKCEKTIKILKISPRSEEEKDPTVKCVLTYLEAETGTDGIEQSIKVNAKTYVEIPTTQLNKVVKFEADVSPYYMNGKSGLSVKLRKVI
jgi:ribosomal protein S4E